jgi:hypothetical protein
VERSRSAQYQKETRRGIQKEVSVMSGPNEEDDDGLRLFTEESMQAQMWLQDDKDYLLWLETFDQEYE